MVTTSIQFTAQADHPALRLLVYLDDQIMHCLEHSTDPTQMEIIVDDSTESDHVLAIELQGKTTEHTQIDAEGLIVQDALMHLGDFVMDGIKIDQLIYDNAQYQHDTNGSGPQIRDRFFGSMGCNGRVTLEFSTPVYLWLLEKM